MNKIIISGKHKFPELVRETKNNGLWGYISIEGTQNPEHYLPDGPDVLNLEFDDVSEVTDIGDGRKALPITEEQARMIVEFGRKHTGYNLLIHCTAGKSRSVGVGLGLSDIFPGVWEVIGDTKTPNIEVLRLIHRESLKSLYMDKWEE